MDNIRINTIRNHWIYNIDRVFTHEGHITTVGNVSCTATEAHILCYIAEHEKITATDLVAHTNKTKSAISQMIKKLEYKNLITRKPDEQRKTQFFLSLTELGTEMYKAHRAFDNSQFDKLISALNENFTEEELDIAFRVIGYAAELREKR